MKYFTGMVCGFLIAVVIIISMGSNPNGFYYKTEEPRNDVVWVSSRYQTFAEKVEIDGHTLLVFRSKPDSDGRIAVIEIRDENK